MKCVKLKRNYLVLLALLVLFACNRKEEEFTLADGVVTDAETGNPIPFATIEVRFEENTPCLWCSGNNRYTTIVFEKQADQDGRFSFGFATNENLRYAISARTDRYYSAKNANVYITKNKANKNLNVSLYSYAWVKIHIKNEPPLDTARIWIDYFYNFNGLGLNDFSGDSVIFINSENPGNVQINYGFEKKNQSIYLTDSLAFISGDTTVLEIKY